MNPIERQNRATLETPVVLRKLPISLSVVSYFFFTVGILEIVFGFASASVAGDHFPVSLIFGVLYLFMSRGLRRCSRGWHICGLICTLLAISCLLILMAGGVLNYFFHGKEGFPYRFLLVLAFIFLVEVWTLYVLVRADVRRLFY